MSPFSVVMSEVMADFQPGFNEVAEAAAIEQLGFEAAPKGFGMRIIVAIAASAHALHDLVARH